MISEAVFFLILYYLPSYESPFLLLALISEALSTSSKGYAGWINSKERIFLALCTVIGFASRIYASYY
jgi:hypothetical protein